MIIFVIIMIMTMSTAMTEIIPVVVVVVSTITRMMVMTNNMTSARLPGRPELSLLTPSLKTTILVPLNLSPKSRNPTPQRLDAKLEARKYSQAPEYLHSA